MIFMTEDHRDAEESLRVGGGLVPATFFLCEAWIFQLADLVCTLHLIELRLENGMPMTQSETRFFGGPRDFKRNVLKKIKAKELL